MKCRSIRIALSIVATIAAMVAPSSAVSGQSAVLFDESHGQRFLIGGVGPLQLSTLAGVLAEGALEVRSGTNPLTQEVLGEIDSLIISGSFQPLASEEIKVILDWLDEGGRLAVMLHIGPPVADLLHQLGISISNGVIREADGVIGKDPINFTVSRLQDHDLFDGFETFNIYGAWALLAHGHHAEGIAETGPLSWVDLNRDRVFTEGDAIQQFSVVVEGAYGEGRFVIFGDDTMFQNQFLHENNERLARNLAIWLGGDKHTNDRTQLISAGARRDQRLVDIAIDSKVKSQYCSMETQ